MNNLKSEGKKIYTHLLGTNKALPESKNC